MLQIFLKKPKIELISLHIPKTAGTSFRDTLKSAYGRSAVCRVDGKKLLPSLPRGTRVLHGHFRWPLVRDFYNLSDDTPIITWVRDPVDRVISNYYYLSKMLKGRLEKGKDDLNILSKMQKTLLEYAGAEQARNRMSKFLTGVELERLLFVGICERFEEDVKELASLLGWKKHSVFHHNDSSSERREVEDDVRAEIRRLNELDLALYEKALDLMSKRQASR